MRDHGVNAFLVGEAFMRAANRAKRWLRAVFLISPDERTSGASTLAKIAICRLLYVARNTLGGRNAKKIDPFH
jgi:hypothetical protein